MGHTISPTCARARRKAATRDKIIAAARAVFAGGYEQATMRAIAKAAGMSTGAIFASFADKADLYRAIYGHDPITPEQGRELIAVLRGEAVRPRWLLAMAGG